MSKAKVDLKKLTVQQAEKSVKEGDTALYVMNRTGNPNSSTPDSGNINFSIRNDGLITAVSVPVTWIPYDLSLFAPKEAILRDANFRRTVMRGLIYIIDSDEASSFIQGNEKATRELDRLLNVNSEQEGSLNVGVDQQQNPQAPEADSKISPFAQNIVVRSSEEDVNDLVVELDTKEHTLTDDDLTYILDNTANAVLKQWATEVIEIRKA